MRVKEGPKRHRYFPEPDLPIQMWKMLDWASTQQPASLSKSGQSQVCKDMASFDYDAKQLTAIKRCVRLEAALQQVVTLSCSLNWLQGRSGQYLNAEG